MNAREQLEAAANWLGWNDENLSQGLRSAQDGLRLYAYAQAHGDLPEMADEWEPAELKNALGYDPLAKAMPWDQGTPILNKPKRIKTHETLA